jgi:hypothetical protein
VLEPFIYDDRKALIESLERLVAHVETKVSERTASKAAKT